MMFYGLGASPGTQQSLLCERGERKQMWIGVLVEISYRGRPQRRNMDRCCCKNTQLHIWASETQQAGTSTFLKTGFSLLLHFLFLLDAFPASLTGAYNLSTLSFIMPSRLRLAATHTPLNEAAADCSHLIPFLLMLRSYNQDKKSHKW